MKSTKGFTLIEMVVVIVILGILAVTAAPRFLNLQSDARKATLDGFIGAFKAADGIVMGKASIHGVEKSAYRTLVPGTEIYVEAGHINIHPSNIKRAMNADDYHFLTTYPEDSTADTKSTIVYQSNKELIPEEVEAKNCFVQIKMSAEQKHGDNFKTISGLIYDKHYDGC